MAFTSVFLVALALQALAADAIDLSLPPPRMIPVNALPSHCWPVFSDPSDPNGRNLGLHQIHSDIVCIGGFCYKNPKGIPVTIPRIPGTKPFDQPPPPPTRPIVDIDGPERPGIGLIRPVRPIGPDGPTEPFDSIGMTRPAQELAKPVRIVSTSPDGASVPDECNGPEEATDRKFFMNYPNYIYPSYTGAAIVPQPYAPTAFGQPYGPAVRVSPWV